MTKVFLKCMIILSSLLIFRDKPLNTDWRKGCCFNTRLRCIVIGQAIKSFDGESQRSASFLVGQSFSANVNTLNSSFGYKPEHQILGARKG